MRERYIETMRLPGGAVFHVHSDGAGGVRLDPRRSDGSWFTEAPRGRFRDTARRTLDCDDEEPEVPRGTDIAGDRRRRSDSQDPSDWGENWREPNYRREQHSQALRDLNSNLRRRYHGTSHDDARWRLRAKLRDRGWHDDELDAILDYFDQWVASHTDGIEGGRWSNFGREPSIEETAARFSRRSRRLIPKFRAGNAKAALRVRKE